MRDAAQGDDLVAALGTRTAVLMRGHGCVVTGADVRQGVSAVYLERNAAVLATALGTRRRASLSDAETQRGRDASRPCDAGHLRKCIWQRKWLGEHGVISVSRAARTDL